MATNTERIAALEKKVANMVAYRKETGVGTVHHGENNNVARPGGYAIILWQGSVTPIHAVDGDLWVVGP